MVGQMPRPLRDQSAGIRHITCRGNRRQAVFLDELDRWRYLWLLDEACNLYGWSISGYCLMRNHVHLVARVGGGTISPGMQWLSGRYGQLFNRRRRETGHLFQGRFRAEIVEDEAYALEVVRYGDLNPVRACVVRRPTDWVWSSHRALVGLDTPLPFHDVEATLALFSANRDAAQAHYANYVAERLRQPDPAQIRHVPRPNRGQTPG
jgi:REP element-mobilizing transposase RayT